MASIQARRRGRSTYYYLVESRRVDGKPRPVVLEYLGKADALLERLRGADQARRPLRARVVEFGALAALHAMAQRLDLAATIERHVPALAGRGPGVGTYLTLAAINRCVATTSKAGFADWYQRGVLARLRPVATRRLSSQRFWDAMSVVTPKAIAAIEGESAARVVRDFDVDLRTLCFDCTNFDTYVATTTPGELARRGHAKSKRSDLRVLGLALLVSADGEVPLLSCAYPGNQPDPVIFGEVRETLFERHRAIAGESADVTLVFDKGNNSDDNLRALAESPYHVVGSLVPSQHKDLLAVDLGEFESLAHPRLDGVQAHRTTKTLHGCEWTVVVTRSEALLEGQRRGIEQELGKRLSRLDDLRARLRRSQEPGARGRGFTRESLEKQARELCSAQYLRDFVTIDVIERDGRVDLELVVDEQRRAALERERLGKRILFTDNHDWDTAQIVLAYRAQHHVEASFRQMKGGDFVHFARARHWTDQKLRVHAFYCVLALLLASLLRREVERAGITLTVDALLDQLQDIREVVNLYAPHGGKGGRPRAESVLSERSVLQQQLFDLLQLERYAPRGVYAADRRKS